MPPRSSQRDDRPPPLSPTPSIDSLAAFDELSDDAEEALRERIALVYPRPPAALVSMSFPNVGH